jgi:hypothetical protein
MRRRRVSHWCSLLIGSVLSFSVLGPWELGDTPSPVLTHKTASSYALGLF